MIENYVVVGDQHGNFTYMLQNLQLDNYDPETTAIIALGDFGLNFYLNKTDEKKKAMLNNRGYKFYLVRGNHEARPEDLPNIKKVFDEEVSNYIYLEEEYPNIRYLLDGRDYMFGKFHTLVLGGAYSVDKEYRLLNHYPWFENEQLSKEEMDYILKTHSGESYDFIFAHTCPLSFQPLDLFLPFIDQSKVDNSMEIWLEDFIQKINFNYFLFGHYHQDRKINDKAYMLYHNLIPLDNFLSGQVW